MRKAPEDSEEKRVREVLRRSIGESRLWTEAGVCIDCGSSNVMFELFFHGNYSGLSKSTKDSVGLRELGTARKLYPPEPEERARAGPNSKGQLASNREGQEQ